MSGSGRYIVANTMLKVMVLDAVLLVALALVLGDLQWRVDYASTRNGYKPAYAAAFAYSLLTRTFSMTGGAIQLTSPLTLDWVQVISVALVVVNGWYFYGLLRKRAGKPEMPTSSS